MDGNETDESVGGLGELERQLRVGFFDGLVRQLRYRLPQLGPAQIEDAVADAVEAVVRRVQQAPLRGDIRSYVFKAALRSATKSAARVGQRAELPLEEWREDPVPSAERQALRKQAIELLFAEVRSWENANIREVTLVSLECLLDPAGLMETEDIAETVSQILGEEINPNSVRTWRARGFRKLQDFARQVGGFDLHPVRVRKDEAE